MSITSAVRSPLYPTKALTQGLALTYISFIILLPLGAIFLEASKRPWRELWSLVTAPVALEAYKLSFSASLVAALINSVFGLILAWILVRYDFPGKRLADGLVDLPSPSPVVLGSME